MKRFRRGLFNGVAGISLVLSLAGAALWARSYSYAEDLIYYGHSGGVAMHDAKGRLAFVFENVMSMSPHFEYYSSTPVRGLDYADPRRTPTLWNRLGFYIVRFTRARDIQKMTPPPGMSWPPVVRYTDVVVPFWLVLLVLALLPFWNFVLPILRGARLQPGYCAKCGYDLRATPDRCPECGTIPPKKEIISS